MESRLIPEFENGAVCHPEPAVLSGGRTRSRSRSLAWLLGLLSGATLLPLATS